MLRHQINDLVYYRFMNLASFDEIFHGIFTRLGGVSLSPYDSLNVGHFVGDDHEAVEANHDLICQALGISRGDITAAQQVHGSQVTLVGPEDRGQVLPVTDALVTDALGVALMLRFADCLPVLLYDPVHQAIGLAHAGWRGTIAGIAMKTVSAMTQAYGSRPADIIAGLGPCIGPCCYQVGTEVIEPVKANLNHWQELLHPQGDGSLHFDLWEANRRQLAELGAPPLSPPTLRPFGRTQGRPCSGQALRPRSGQALEGRKGGIEVMQLCTACRTDEFFSHRAEGGHTGCFAVVLGMRG